MGKHSIRFLLATLVFGGLSAPIVVEAQSVIVLGLRSAEGDDELANNVSGALRNAASRVSGWELNTREVSLAQMTLAHGCEAADVACMEAIGSTLGVRLVIYGTVRRTSTSADHDYAVNIFMFDTESGSITDQITDTISQVQADVDDLRPRVQRFIARFSGAEQTGTIRVQVNLASAEVFVDGESLGTTTGGALETTVPVGQHEVEVRAQNHNTFRGTVTVIADESVEVEVELIEGDEDEIIVAPVIGEPSPGGGGGPNWGAITSFGVAGVGAVLTVVSWVMINSASSDLQDSRIRVGQELGMLVPRPSNDAIMATDACQYMRDIADPTTWGDSRSTGISVCDQGALWQTLQYVFIAVAGVGAVAGILFIVLDDDEESPSTVSIRPSFGPGRGSVSASLTF
jgi:hypothetical protein